MNFASMTNPIINVLGEPGNPVLMQCYLNVVKIVIIYPFQIPLVPRLMF
jgi:hypothetical protein